MSENEEKNNFTDKIKETAQKVWNTTDTTEQYEAEDKEKNKWWAALAYVLAPIPYFAKKDSKYVNYHSTQGMNYFVVAVGFAVISAILQAIIKVKKAITLWGITIDYIKVTPWWVSVPLNIISILIGVIGIIGIVNALSGKAKELPILNKVKIFK